jgi:hypothetical protein
MRIISFLVDLVLTVILTIDQLQNYEKFFLNGFCLN